MFGASRSSATSNALCPIHICWDKFGLSMLGAEFRTQLRYHERIFVHMAGF